MSSDPRIHASLHHLRSFQAVAKGLSFLPHQPAASVLNGRHASRLRGRGLNFEEMRGYLPGDDVRSIDWKATARTGKPHVRIFTEERDRPALLVVDQRMSMFFGSQLNMKSVTAAEAAAIASFRVIDAGDRVGGIVFNDTDSIEISPRRSRRNVFAFLETIAEQNAMLDADRQVSPTPGRLNAVLESVVRMAHHDHLVIVLSDFDGIDETTHRRLSDIARHNDLVLALVFDPLAERLDHERPTIIGDGYRQAEIDLASGTTRRAVESFTQGRLQRIRNWQQEINLSVLPLSAGEETLPQIQRLMGSLAMRRRIR